MRLGENADELVKSGAAKRVHLLFLCLILSQVAHSVEEYSTRLYIEFIPARFVSGLISNNLAHGFVLLNAALVIFGLWCWAIPVRTGTQAARCLIWVWILLELGNGFGHVALAWWRGGYFPGVATAPLLVLFAVWLTISEVPLA